MKKKQVRDKLPTARELRRQGLLLEGDKAISKAEELKGAPLDALEREVVLNEGYALAPYRDSKGVVTTGFGQTGPFLTKDFFEVLDHKKRQLANIFPDFDTLPEYTQVALMSLKYRGDVNKNYNWVKAFNEGDYTGAASNLLKNVDYQRSKRTGQGGITKRFETAADSIRQTIPADETERLAARYPEQEVSYDELSGRTGTGLESFFSRLRSMF